jgi:hypothetical protein
MFRFFRKLRYQLLDEGHLRKYAAYAVGEILLVVIGILIALQINNWNENNKTMAQEKILKASLLESVARLGVVADHFTGAEEANIRVIEALIKNWSEMSYDDIDGAFPEFQNDFFSPVFNLSGYSQFFDPEKGVYNTAISDGSISIIQDEVFLARLDRLYNYITPRVNELMIEEYVLNRSINEHIATHYQELFLKNSIVDSTIEASNVWTPETYRELFIAIRNDGVLKYKLSQRIELKRSRLLLVNQAKGFVDVLLQDQNQGTK